jgi:hypothetical protein
MYVGTPADPGYAGSVIAAYEPTVVATVIGALNVKPSASNVLLYVMELLTDPPPAAFAAVKFRATVVPALVDGFTNEAFPAPSSSVLLVVVITPVLLLTPSTLTALLFFTTNLVALLAPLRSKSEAVLNCPTPPMGRYVRTPVILLPVKVNDVPEPAVTPLLV